MPTNTPDTDWLIDQAKRFESLATSTQTFNDNDLIEFFNAELQTVVMPVIQSVNEEFGTMYTDYNIPDLVGQKSIRIPSQASGSRLANIQYVTSQGIITNMARLDPNKLASSSYGFYIRNNEIVFYPKAPSWSSGTLRVSYFRRPNTLVSTLDAGKVLVVDKVNGTVSLDNSPTGSGWSFGGSCDFIIPSSPFDYRVRDIPIVNRTGSSIQFDPADVQEIEVGDIVARAGYSPVPQFIPLEAMQYLAQLGACRALQSLGDTEGWKISSAKANEMRNHLVNLISDRVQGQPKRLSAIGTSARATRGTFWN